MTPAGTAIVVGGAALIAAVLAAVLVVRGRGVLLSRLRGSIEASLTGMVAPLTVRIAMIETSGAGLSGLKISVENLDLLSPDGRRWATFGRITATVPPAALLPFRRAGRAGLGGPWLFSRTTVDVLRPQPPFEDLHGIATPGETGLRFDIAGGRWGVLSVGGAMVNVEHRENEPAEIDTRIRCSGAAVHALRTVTTPPLDIVDTANFDLTDLGGAVETESRVRVTFTDDPMIDHRTTARIRNLRLPGGPAGATLDRGRFDVTVENRAVELDGGILLGGTPIDIRFSRSTETPRRRVRFDGADVDALAKALGLSGRLEGGVFRLELERSTDDRPWTGELSLHSARIVEAPLLARLLTMASLPGLLSTLTDTGLVIDRARAGISVDDGRLTLDPIGITVDQLEITGRASIGLECRSIDARGRLIPAASLQRLASTVPLVGAFLEGFGRKNTPLVATEFSVSGPLSNPEIIVYPLSSLPGIPQR